MRAVSVQNDVSSREVAVHADPGGAITGVVETAYRVPVGKTYDHGSIAWVAGPTQK